MLVGKAFTAFAHFTFALRGPRFGNLWGRWRWWSGRWFELGQFETEKRLQRFLVEDDIDVLR